MHQNPNTIQNPTPANESQPKGPQMDDQDRLNDVLATEKYMTDSFNVAVREASHQSLHQDMMMILNESHQAARHAFELMFQKGWYKLEAAEQQKLDQSHQQFSGYTSQLPYSLH